MVDSAGTGSDAEVPVTCKHLEGAHHLVLMEAIYWAQLNECFGFRLKGKRITVLGISDDYELMDEKLVEVFKQKVSISCLDSLIA